MDPLRRPQEVVIDLAKDKNCFGIFHAMGAGKTRSAIEIVNYKFDKGDIDCLVVICQLSVTLVWKEQTKMWGLNEDLPKFIVGIESLSQGKGPSLVTEFLDAYESPMLIIDESTKIKNFKTKRTKRCWEFSRRSKARLILTGEPITQGKEDLFSQFFFLHPHIIGEKSYYSFRNKYCIMGGFQGKKVIGYQNEEELMKRIAPYVHVVSKEEAMPYLPPKVYEKRIITPSKEQEKVMIDLKELFKTEYNGVEVEVTTVLERLLRYQQIVGGHFPIEKGRCVAMEKNPKLDALTDLIDTIPENEKVIIWARFKPEIRSIYDSLARIYGEDFVETFYGDVSMEDREWAIKSFQEGPARFFVATQSAAGMGLTLTAANIAIYYSNTFSWEDRTQSEDRCHREGSQIHNSVVYIDMIMDHPIDKLILATLQRKKHMATWVREQLHAKTSI